MSEIKIEKRVPIPAWHADVMRHAAYPFGQMKVGDSFAVEAKQLKAVRVAMWREHREQGVKGRRFTSRNRGGEVRVWRVR